MRSLVGGAEAGGADVRVDLRRHEALVAQEFLHAADVGAAVQEVRREAVPERVGRGATIETRGSQILFEHPADAAGGEAAAEAIDEERLSMGLGLGDRAATLGPLSRPSARRTGGLPNTA